jgi:hypothetical protein
MHSVNYGGSEPVAQFGQRRSKDREVPSFVRRQTSVNVFENERAQSALLLRQASDQFQKGQNVPDRVVTLSRSRLSPR